MFVGEVLRNVDSVHLFRNLWREEGTSRVRSQAGPGMPGRIKGAG